MSEGSGKILSRIQSVLSTEELSAKQAELSSYNIVNPLIQNGTKANCIARPRDTSKLQELVRLANTDGLHLVPVSSSPPHCKGGIACPDEHVVVDLSHWKGCHTIDRRNRVCTIEPGVTYGELLDALAPHGMCVSMPLAPRSGKSVVAAVMDREPSTWPNRQWDAGDPAGCIEFVFGTGDTFRTGAAGGPGTIEEQRAAGGAQKAPLGPSQTDFHRVLQGAQGSMGIVTWITIRTELKPSVQQPRMVGADDLKDLIPFVYRVQRPGLGEHSFILNRTATAMLMSASDTGGFEGIRDSLPAFICIQNIAGFERMAEERVDYQMKEIHDIAANSGLSLLESGGEVSAKDLLNRATRPCGEKDWRHALEGHCLSIFFLSTLDRAQAFTGVMYEKVGRHSLDNKRMGIYIQPVVQNHACHFEFMIPFDPDDSNEVDKLRAFEIEAVHELAKAGAFFSRPYGAATDIAFERNRLNVEVLKKIKGIFDPNRVLNPGRFGL